MTLWGPTTHDPTLRFRGLALQSPMYEVRWDSLTLCIPYNVCIVADYYVVSENERPNLTNCPVMFDSYFLGGQPYHIYETQAEPENQVSVWVVSLHLGGIL